MSVANEEELDDERENETNESGRSRKRPIAKRTLFVEVADLDLSTPDGQDTLMQRIQVLLATRDHNNLDLRALTALKDTVKIKTDLSILRMFHDMQKKMKELEGRIKQ